MKSFEIIVGSRTRAEIFRLLFLDPSAELYMRELQRRTDVSSTPIQEELQSLLELGLVRARKDGNRLYYSSNPKHPYFPEICKIVEKTYGIEALLTGALVDPSIKIAFIFGSIAGGTARPESDIDLFIVGNIGLRRVIQLISGLSDKVSREINPYVLNESEFRRRVQERDHFVTSVLSTRKTFILGDESELRELGQ